MSVYDPALPHARPRVAYALDPERHALELPLPPIFQNPGPDAQ
ncbi:MAG TPA: hypothetical protein VMU75_02965 [Acidimicrobiales bacterium]|nr:hypothetical protein [Acidimicrobiales bacterium]